MNGRFHRRTAPFLAGLAIWIILFGLQAGPARAEEAEQPIRGIVLAGAPEGGFPAGRTSPATLIIGINPGFHLNSDRPPLKWLSPTSLHFDAQPHIEVVEVAFPEPVERRFEFFKEPLPVFEKMLMVGLKVRVHSQVPPGPASLTGRLSYQACTDTLCLPPAEQPFELAIEVTTALAGPAGPPDHPAHPPDQVAQPPEGRSLPWLLISIFLGGLALNLTPCVYPLIPITIAYFGGQTRSRAGLLAHGLSYLIGLMATYTALGLVAALTGGILGSALQHPATLIVVAAVLLILAAAMLGAYEFRLPGFLNRLGNLGAGRRGYLGSLIMGLTLGLVAAPCIGPFTLGAFTLVARSGDPSTGAVVFAALSFGLGLPLAVLGLFSSRLAGALPTSGPWLVWVRRLLGVVLVFMAVYFLRPLMSDTLWHWLMGLVLLGGGVLAFWGGLGIKPFVRAVVGIVFLAVAAYFVIPSGAVHEAHWPLYTPEKFAQVRAEERPVVLDFFADWCVPCRELNKNLAHPQVKPLVESVTGFKVDLSDWDSPVDKELRQRYDIRGVPTLVFLGPSGQEKVELRVIGPSSPAGLARRFKSFLAEEKKEPASP